MLSQHMDTMGKSTDTEPAFHKLSDNWTLWAHLPHNTDWSLNSYIPIFTFKHIEETIAITESLPSHLIENCMLFIMREGINPIWEDKRNRSGGSFSYKVINKNVQKAWCELTYRIVGGTISNELPFVNSVSGITISPKKNFSIIKIWMSNCEHQNANVISNVKGLQSHGCIFKKHVPEY